MTVGKAKKVKQEKWRPKAPSGARLKLGALTVVVTAGIVGALLLVGVESSKAPVVEAEQRVSERARALAADAASSFGSVDQRLQRLVRLLEGKERPAGGRPLDAGAMIRAAADVLPQVRNLLFIDGNGRVVAGVSPLGKGPRELRESSFHAAHRDRNSGLHVGRPEAGSSGQWTIAVSRRVTRTRGDFGGVVVAFIDPLRLRPSLDETVEREHLESALVTPAGQIVVSSSSFGGVGTETIGQAVQIGTLVASPNAGSGEPTRLLADGPEQLAAAVAVEGWPLVAVANVDHAGVIAQSEGAYRSMVAAAVAVVVAAGLIILALLIVSPPRSARA